MGVVTLCSGQRCWYCCAFLHLLLSLIRGMSWPHHSCDMLIYSVTHACVVLAGLREVFPAAISCVQLRECNFEIYSAAIYSIALYISFL